MPIEMPKGVPFSVDTWSSNSKRTKRHHFLSHAHKDHSSGISAHFSFPIFSTALTKSLILQQFPKVDDSVFVGIEAGQSLVLDDPDGSFTVTAFDANHCPGAVMFLFEGNFGNILYTGDCRLTPECLRNLPDKYLGKNGQKPRCSLDYVFLDCTFGKFSRSMPSKHVAIRQVIDCIWKHPDAAAVYLTCDLLGQEEILAAVCRTFGYKVYVDKATNPECFHALTLLVPEILSEDPSSRFRLFNGFPKLYERAQAVLLEARAKLEPEPLIIRPSSMWYVCEEEASGDERREKVRMDEAVRDQFGVWHVCYSMHSSREELESALQRLAPKWVISTTTSCMAMELDYAKKHCFSARLSPDNPLWKLLDITVEAPLVKHLPSSKLQQLAQQLAHSSCTSSELELVETSTSHKQRFNLSPKIKRPPVTLFGRARVGLHDSPRPQQKKIAKKDRDRSSDELEREFSCREERNCKATPKEPLMNNPTLDMNELQSENSAVKESDILKGDEQSLIGSSKSYNERLRKLYRSMNVPVPRPLPSLVELLKTTKSVKRKSMI